MAFVLLHLATFEQPHLLDTHTHKIENTQSAMLSLALISILNSVLPSLAASDRSNQPPSLRCVGAEQMVC